MKFPILKEGALLPLVESFYTIQGEGFNTGKPAYFIRLGGCDVGCSWCDAKETWNPSLYPPVPVEDIVKEALNYPAKAIVITGGEPLNYPLEKLCSLLKSNGLEIFLETSGSSSISGSFDWICLSPKKKKPPVREIYKIASELKVIIENEEDFIWAEKNKALVGDNCMLYLQPEWSRIKTMLPKIIEYVKANPCWNISLQTHKYMNIP
ncbi:MAG: 7-carboxy-7-deazaguanine synthase QueE [Bacteroidales bacterium]|jgi:organic radical activating enzyme|nr:7-carboxy-7-deazaguanine synthase QueE [Bacteroidales bacterium]MDD2280314.1 7-carboxy-7-deazaguanine synthase QueE [Bacteroidales bacterium]MDD4292314.1 7-carboxy-7-deazaguanine synthase QueE [Bacteroidales bacterium]MDD4492549.1 7-carboxy-7-deazaguanine synthase QueE [Bacteroidales bacterium]